MSSSSLTANPTLIVAGTTILIPSGVLGKFHLFVAIYNSKNIDNIEKVLLIPFETRVPKCDDSCLLVKDDHVFINHPSFVGYFHARNELLNHVTQCLANKIYKQDYPAISNELLIKIQKGYSVTKRVPRHIIKEWPPY